MYSTQKIVVTGCSFSTGMEMYDSHLTPFSNRAQRDAHILKWGKNNLKLSGMDIFKMKDIAFAEWESKERSVSWPALLETRSGIPVENLSRIGASVGHSLLSFSEYCSKKDTMDNVIAIHQIPSIGRMELRIEPKNRVTVQPANISGNFGYDKTYFEDAINQTKNVFKERMQKPNYVEKHFEKIITRLHNISSKNNVTSYYIVDSISSIPDCIKNNILIDDFTSFKEKYQKGTMGHPIDIKYNQDICDICLPILY